MEGKKDKESPKKMILPQPTPSDLRGRQSVRATFKVSEKAIDALSIISTHLGIKQKSLFDHLIDDAEALRQIAREVQARDYKEPDRVQKTFVLSRRTLLCLERASQNFEASRDAIVEYSLQRLLPLIEKEKERHERRKQIFGSFKNYLREGNRIHDQAKKWLGEEDPVCEKLEEVLISILNAHRTIESIIERGKNIENL